MSLEELNIYKIALKNTRNYDNESAGVSIPEGLSKTDRLIVRQNNINFNINYLYYNNIREHIEDVREKIIEVKNIVTGQPKILQIINPTRETTKEIEYDNKEWSKIGIYSTETNSEEILDLIYQLESTALENQINVMKMSRSSEEKEKTEKELESLMNEIKINPSAPIKYPTIGEESSNRAEERE